MTMLPTPAPVVHSLHGETMGTRWSVQLVAARDADLHALHHGVQGELDRVVAQMSTWEPDSDLSRFNGADAGTWQRIPTDFMTVLRCALAIARASEGAFDPTIGALVGLWGFGAHARDQRKPETTQVRNGMSHAGWQRVQLDVEGSRVLQAGGVELDLSAIAKGYGVDLAASWLRSAGVRAALVEVGGELYGYGHKPDNSAWRVLMESSPDEEAAADLEPRVITLQDAAIATSGDRWHAFEQEGMRYSHTLDPRTGSPVAQASVGVSVLADSAMLADAWATALTVLGANAGIALADRLGLAVRFVVRGETGLREHLSTALHERMSA